MTEAYICDAIRTPIGRYGGSLAHVRADDLAAIRARLRLSSPAWLAQPRMTSSSSPQSTLALRSMSALIGIAARSSARTELSAPPYRPIGVRM